VKICRDNLAATGSATVLVRGLRKSKIGVLFDTVSQDDTSVRVKEILTAGVIPKWNAKQPSKKVQVDDLITDCNGVTDARKIVQTVNSASVLTLTVSRVDPPVPPLVYSNAQ